MNLAGLTPLPVSPFSGESEHRHQGFRLDEEAQYRAELPQPNRPPRLRRQADIAQDSATAGQNKKRVGEGGEGGSTINGHVRGKREQQNTAHLSVILYKIFCI